MADQDISIYYRHLTGRYHFRWTDNKGNVKHDQLLKGCRRRNQAIYAASQLYVQLGGDSAGLYHVSSTEDNVKLSPYSQWINWFYYLFSQVI